MKEEKMSPLRDYWRDARPEGPAVSGQTQNHGIVTAPVEPGVYLGQAYGRDQ
jgi:hypothetical protein